MQNVFACPEICIKGHIVPRPTKMFDIFAIFVVRDVREMSVLLKAFGKVLGKLVG